jgi:hypothetical protein
VPRATVINLRNKYVIVTGEPILDTEEGVLIIAFDDGTSRTFNWDHVIDYYWMSESEYAFLLNEASDEEDL